MRNLETLGEVARPTSSQHHTLLGIAATGADRGVLRDRRDPRYFCYRRSALSPDRPAARLPPPEVKLVGPLLVQSAKGAGSDLSFARHKATACLDRQLSADRPLIWLGPDPPIHSQSSTLSHTYPVCRPPATRRPSRCRRHRRAPSSLCAVLAVRCLCLIGQVRR